MSGDGEMGGWGDAAKRRHGDAATRGRGDTETRGRGAGEMELDKTELEENEPESTEVSASPCLRVPATVAHPALGH